MSRLTIFAAAVLAGLAVAVGTSTPAFAHAIIELKGDPAYAGKSSAMTLQIQHGCPANEVGIDKVAVFYDPAFGKVVPQEVSGWAATTTKTRDGRKVVWTLTGAVPSFNTPTYFPMRITWPKKAGVYGIPVKQWCDGETNLWDTPDSPATAHKPSPPLYPLPQVKVLPAP